MSPFRTKLATLDNVRSVLLIESLFKEDLVVAIVAVTIPAIHLAKVPDLRYFGTVTIVGIITLPGVIWLIVKESTVADESKIEVKPTADPKSKTFLDQALQGTVILTLATGLIFFVGWYYQESYYARFGMSVANLDFATYEFPSSGVLVVTRHFVWLLLAMVLFAVLLACEQMSALLLNKGLKIRHHWFVVNSLDWAVKSFWAATRGFFLVFCFWLLAIFANRDGERAALDASPVELKFKGPMQPDLEAANREGSLRLVVQTKDLVFVFEKPDYRPNEKTFSVYTISRSDLLSLRTFAPRTFTSRRKASR